MASTLKRTYTDIMEMDDLELTKTITNNNNKAMSASTEDQQYSQSSQNDFLQYLSLPNVSQESLQKLLEPDLSDQTQNSTEIAEPLKDETGNNHSSADVNVSATAVANPGNVDVYNAYANPGSLANPHLTDYLYTNVTPVSNYKQPNANQVNPQFTNTNHLDNTTFNDYNYTPDATPETANVYSDDILMVPQDNFYVYDQQDPQFIPEMMQLELNNKSFPHSNELNIFKANDVLYEFSDDEDEDDDLYMQNNDDMEMKMDEDDDEDDEDDDLYEPHRPLISSSVRNNDHLLLNDNSIYSLTIPNHITPDSLSASPTNHFPSPLSSTYNNVNLYGSDDGSHGEEEDDDAMYNYFGHFDGDRQHPHHHHDDHIHSDDEEEEEKNDSGEQEEEEDDDIEEDEYAIGMDLDDGIHNPAFRERKQSVVAESKPRFNKDRSYSSRSNTKPKRVRRASASASASSRAPTVPTLRKPKTAVTSIPASEKQFSISTLQSTLNHDDASEDHVCNIPNLKTGKPCLKRFSRPYDLVRHQNTIHASKRSFYRCMFCEDDLRRKHDLESNNEIVDACKYRNSQFSIDNSQSHVTSSHNIKKIKAGAFSNSGYLSNKTFSRCDALTRHLRFRHGLNNNQVVDAMDYAKKHVEYYDN